MKIDTLNTVYSKPNFIKTNYHNRNLNNFDAQQKELQFHTAPVSFKANSVAYLKAKEYITKEFPKLRTSDLFRYDLKKLNGIQEGIKVFKGMTMAEIAFVLTTVSEFATVRGCKNNCLHCYANAKPAIKEDDTHTNKMLWEDFIALTDGIKELNNRLGFKASCKTLANKERYLTAFHDSDTLDVVLKDKLGNEHDFIEIADRLYDSMEVKIIFDTAGWNLSDKKSQEKMEKYIKHYSDYSNRKKLDDINISFNPFHSLHTKEIDLRREGKTDLADKMHKLYINRMANTLFTFTPLLFQCNENFNILACATQEDKLFEGFRLSDTLELFQETLDKLKELYKKDFEGEQKYIDSENKIKSAINMYDEKLAARYISFLEKATDYFGVENHYADEAMDTVLGNLSNLEKTPNSIDKYRNGFVGIIDANGDFYMTNYNITLPTEIKLNFDNKRKTAPIRPYLRENFLIKRTDVNNFPIKG